jgi:hypothetical protein
MNPITKILQTLLLMKLQLQTTCHLLEFSTSHHLHLIFLPNNLLLINLLSPMKLCKTDHHLQSRPILSLKLKTMLEPIQILK